MLAIGGINSLTVKSRGERGLLLDAGNLGELLLAAAELRALPATDCEPGARLDVFIYSGPGDHLQTTLQRPLAMVGEFAWLRVVGQ